MIFAANDDTPRAALPMLDNALLWAMQAWVVGHCRGGNVAGRIAGVFGELGAPEASGYLDGFMWVLSQGATRLLEVNCVCCDRVSADERALLDVFALTQEGQGEEAMELLCTMMTAGAALAARSSATRLVAALNEAGRLLPESRTALHRYMMLQAPGRLISASPAWLH
jgi:hypothetical protein